MVGGLSIVAAGARREGREGRDEVVGKGDRCSYSSIGVVEVAERRGRISKDSCGWDGEC